MTIRKTDGNSAPFNVGLSVKKNEFVISPSGKKLAYTNNINIQKSFGFVNSAVKVENTD